MIKIPIKARAAVLERIGAALAVRTIDLPALDRGQVLVKIYYSGVCRSQLMEVKGGRGNDPWLPHLLGHEGSGVVVDIGEGVSKVKPGEEVILGWIKSKGIDAPCAKYGCGAQVINSGRVTTFSNYTVVSESRVGIKPKGLSFREAVLFGCALPTGFGMVINEAKPERDANVAVLGLGGIGLSALMALKTCSPKSLIAIDISDSKLALAKDLGASHVINSACQDLQTTVADLTDGGVDLCIESGGSVATIEMGFSIIKKGGGRLLFASHPHDGTNIRLSPFDLISGKQIAGSWGGASEPDRDIPRMFDLLRGSKAPLDRLINRQYALEEINVALEDLESGRVFRPLIKMEHDVL